VATLTQRRFAYYLVVNIALLSAYISWQIIWLVGLRKIMTRPEEITAESKEASVKSKEEKGAGKSGGIYRYHTNIVLTALAIIVVFFSVLYPNIGKSKDVASAASFAPSNAWQASLLWMKENTPEPLDNPDGYYGLYEMPPPGEKYKYPESAYSVTSWWDYGYWITRTAHRIPSVNPSQPAKQIRQVAAFFLSQEVPPTQQTQEIIEELESSYVVIDYDIVAGKFWAVVNWAEQALNQYSEIYYIPTEDQLIGKQLYYPEYYRTMCVRMYNFDGQAVTSVRPSVITYENITSDDGQNYKVLTQVREFASYQAAIDYLEEEGTANQRLVGIDPFTSPVPLEALEDYRIIYSSEYLINHEDLALVQELKIVRFSLPEVKIFEYVGD
jgi:asparagine N-glycosylation enzyme membrane subunit Stt3